MQRNKLIETADDISMLWKKAEKSSSSIEADKPAIFLSTSAFAPSAPIPGKLNVEGSLIGVVPK